MAPGAASSSNKCVTSLRKTMPRSGFFAMFRDQVDRLEQQEIAIKMQEEEQKRLSNLLPDRKRGTGDPPADTGWQDPCPERPARQSGADRFLGQLVPTVPDREPEREEGLREIREEGLRDPRCVAWIATMTSWVKAIQG